MSLPTLRTAMIFGPLALPFVFALLVAAGPRAMASEGAFVGLQVQGITPAVGEALGAPDAGGVLVRDVALHGPAAHAGVRRGDLIVRIGASPIGTFEDLIKTVEGLPVSADARMHVRRGGETVVLTIRPAPWPAGWRVSRGSFAALPSVGVTLSSLTDPVRQRFAVPWGMIGVVVTLLDTAASAGLDLKPGDVIAQVNQVDVVEPNQLVDAYQQAKAAGRKNLLVLVGGVGGYRYSLIPVR